ncbi:hypothetical protein ACHAQA_000620 [Verticillium albo-atrum]
MVLLSTLLSLASLAAAHPSRGPAATRVSKRTALLHSYRFGAVPTYTTLDVLPEQSPQRVKRQRDQSVDFVKIATRTLQEAVPGSAFRVIDDSYVGNNGVAHVHFQQTIGGIDVDDANFNVNKDPLVAFRNAVELLDLPISGISKATAEPTDEAGTYVIRGTEGSVSDPKAKLVYVQHAGSALLTWRVETNIDSNWLLTYIDAATGTTIAGVFDYTNTASYEAYPWGSGNPTEVARRVIVNPEDAATSPFGWHSDGSQSYTTLRGNNAFVTISWGASSPSSPSLLFSYPYSPATTDAQSYVNASAAQGFYTVNKFHDILYALGFNEAAGNFQTNNNGKGGAGGDPLQLDIQHSGGSALINVPGDGSSPRIQMGLWSQNPVRDSVFETTVLLHEYMHGVTLRLVGGPGSGRCLSNMDGLSINEGFSDFVPTLLRVKAGDTRSKDYTIAD